MTANMTEYSPNGTAIPSGCIVQQPQVFVPWNNPDNIVSSETRLLVKDLKDMVILPVTFLIGVPANIINMVVFYRQGLKERINVCLFALSLSDGLHLFTYMVTHLENIYSYITGNRETYGPVFTWIINNNVTGICAFIWVSQVLTAIVASERCFCVLQPLKSQTILRTSTMTMIIIAVFIVVVGLRFLVTTRYYLVCAYDPVRDMTVMTGSLSEFYKSHQKLVDYVDAFMYGLGLPWVMIVVVLTTTVITVIKLRQSAEWRADMTSSSGGMSTRDIGVTRMLVGNSIFFIVCTFPFGLFKVLLLFVPELNNGRKYHNMFAIGIFLLNMISYINATFNIVVYYIMGSRYRQIFWTLFGRESTNDTPNKTTTKQTTVSTVN